jgi:hypothetical protein
MATDKEGKKLLAVLYFSSNCGAAYKKLAERVRSEGSRTTLVWSNQFKGPESMIEEARAVIIHKNARAEMIAHAYETLGQDVEIHFADDDGEFIDDEEAKHADKEESVSADSAIQDESGDAENDESASADEPELDTRSDEKFFESAVEDEEDAVDDSGTSERASEE